MITLTDTAAQKVAQLIEAEGASDVALRVSVKSGGCSGFSYDMYFDSDIAADDVTLTFGNVKVVVDPASAPMLEGASTNPNATRSCGCGKSFS
jgi:iron-sulfur cluster assembly protein/iron-sulfur cluster insertion protein